MKSTLSVFLFFIFNISVISQKVTDFAVLLSAEVEPKAASIKINWRPNNTSQTYTVFRKDPAENDWGAPIKALSGSISYYIDNAVEEGVRYEYKVERAGKFADGTNYAAYGYILSGINIPPVEDRGAVLLLVDDRFSDFLSKEINRLKNDLVGDGWEPLQLSVSRQNSPQEIKDLIKKVYFSISNNLKAVFLIGHIPVPYSGEIYPDGHPEHIGAWPADTYYADMYGKWTDYLVSNTNSFNPNNHNIPGDGKFDQSTIPHDLDLAVGRVDFFNMPAFKSSEIALLRKYLNKNHAYRYKYFSPTHRAVIDDNFGSHNGEFMASIAYKTFSPLLGTNNIFAGDYLQSMSNNSFLWSYGSGAGGGTYSQASGVATADEFASHEVNGVFTFLLGSRFGDWDTPDNFLRAAIASGTILVSSWNGRPNIHVHQMGLGETIGECLKISQNNISTYFANKLPRSVHTAIMGDPTLRNDITAPPANLISIVDSGKIKLNWTTSSEPVLGYFIYRKQPGSKKFQRISSNIITDTFFEDFSISEKEIYTYLVRAVNLQVSPSGTYYNLSQGIMCESDQVTSVNIGKGIATEYQLSQNYPNPLNPDTIIEFTLPESVHVKITVYNSTGQEVERLLNQKLGPGIHNVSFNSGNLPSGIYFYRIETPKFVDLKKMIILK